MTSAFKDESLSKLHNIFGVVEIPKTLTCYGKPEYNTIRRIIHAFGVKVFYFQVEKRTLLDKLLFRHRFEMAKVVATGYKDKSFFSGKKGEVAKGLDDSEGYKNCNKVYHPSIGKLKVRDVCVKDDTVILFS